MRTSIKNKVINYYNSCLLGECGYLLTKDCIYQYVGYAETEDELILDVYEGLPVKFWKTRHHIKKNEIIAHFKKRDDLIKYVDLLKETSILLEKLSSYKPRIINLDEHGFDGSYSNSEEGKKKLEELKELLKDKHWGDYTNPGLPINPIYMSKKYLKWEDLNFTYDEQKIKVKLNGEDYTVVYCLTSTYYHRRGYEYVGILKDNDLVIYSIYSDSNFIYQYKKFFNNLHLEVIE